MKQENNLELHFGKSDNERVSAHLDRLLPYLKPEQFVIVGGIAIRHYLELEGKFNDLDIVVRNDRVVSPDMTDKFWVCHVHRVPWAKNQLYWALVDPLSHTKVDIFPGNDYPGSVRTVKYKKWKVLLPTPEHLLWLEVSNCAVVLKGQVTSPKYFEYADQLIKISGIEKANLIWLAKNKDYQGMSILQVYDQTKKEVLKRPELLKEKPYRKSRPYKCRECINLPQFPLTSMEDIYKNLGYTE